MNEYKEQEIAAALQQRVIITLPEQLSHEKKFLTISTDLGELCIDKSDIYFTRTISPVQGQIRLGQVDVYWKWWKIFADLYFDTPGIDCSVVFNRWNNSLTVKYCQNEEIWDTIRPTVMTTFLDIFPPSSFHQLMIDAYKNAKRYVRIISSLF